jgi:hypothetical protein
MTEVDFSANAHLARSEGQARPLRVGLLVEDQFLPRFARRLLEDLQAAHFVQLTCMVDREDRATAEACYAPADGSAVLRAYLKLNESYYLRQPDPFALVDCSDILSGVPKGASSPGQNASAEPIDLYLCLGRSDMAAALPAAAVHGVWALELGGQTPGDGSPPCLRAVLDGGPVIVAALHRIDAEGRGKRVGQIVLSSVPAPSLSENQFNVGWAVPQLVMQSLRWLHQSGSIRSIDPPVPDPAPGTAEGNAALAKVLVPLLTRKTIRRLVRRPQPPVLWRIGIRRSQQPLYSSATPDAVREFTWLDPPPGHFWADPFLLQRDGRTWLFFEDYSYSTGRGGIACGELRGDCELHDVRTVFEPPYHVSYPHVFTHEGELWMIPESETAHRVVLLRASHFPDKWVIERTLLDLRGVDATPFQHDGAWCMFVSPMIADSHFPTTLLFRAPSPLGPWTLHPASPVSTDVRTARCAGRIIHDGKALLRPSQDCSLTYGYALCFNRIEQLDDRNYAETPGAQLLPEWVAGLEGLHSYDRAGDWETIDGKSILLPVSSHQSLTEDARSSVNRQR